MLRSYMEVLVENNLDTVLAEFPDACRCERCRLDMMAHALNNLPPRYVVAERGLTHFRLEETTAQFGSDVLYAISSAVRLIAMRPRHAKEDVGNRLLDD